MQRSSAPLFFQPRFSHRLRVGTVLAALALVALESADALALVADCEDGSVVLASRWEDVHCAGAVEVGPGETPRLGAARRLEVPDWREARRRREAQRELDLETQIDARTRHLEKREPLRAQQRGTLRSEIEIPRQSPGLPGLGATRVALSQSEHDALSRFIERSQERAAADIARSAVGRARLQLAHSRLFESKLRARLAAASRDGSGTVLVFSLAPNGAELGDPPHFGQRGSTFRPQPRDPAQLGWIVREGAQPDETTTRLGYVVLPVGFDLGRPLVLFWGDAVAVARLRP